MAEPVQAFASKVTRQRKVTCKMCLDSRVMEVETWDDRVEPEFEHDCRGKGPQLSHPVTRDGVAIPYFPSGRRVIVQRIPPEAVMGGLHIPDNAKVEQQYATVIAAGPVAQGVLDDMSVAIGDTVCFGKYTGVYFEWQPAGTTSLGARRRVDVIMVDDIYGCKEVAEKLIDGRLGIMLYKMENGEQEYRFFTQIGVKQ